MTPLPAVGEDAFEALRRCAQAAEGPVGSEALLALLRKRSAPGTTVALFQIMTERLPAPDQVDRPAARPAGRAATAVAPEHGSTVAATLREARWRAGRGTTEAGGVAWHDSARTALANTLAEAESAGVVNAGLAHLAAGVLAQRGESARLQRLQAHRIWREDGRPYAPLATALEAHWETDPAPARGLRLMTRVIRRVVAKESRYGAALGRYFEEEIARQAVRKGHPTATSAHLILAIASLGAQLAATGRRLTPKAAGFNEAVQIVDRHGLTLDRCLSAIEAGESEPETLTAEEAANIPLTAGPAWSRELAESLERAIELASERGDPQVGTSHLLIAALSEDGSAATRLMTATGADPAAFLVETQRSLADR